MIYIHTLSSMIKKQKMKKTIAILLFLIFLTGCNNQNLTYKETVTNYYNAFDSSDYNEIRKRISDSITIIGGDYVMPFTRDSFHEQFRWDSVFKPSYKILEIEDENDKIIATVASKSSRYEFLKNNPLTTKFRISFKSGKISKIETLESINADWNIWQKERDSLVDWVEKNHPELDGFINDLTMNGAHDYLKAIELYENDRNTTERR